MFRTSQNTEKDKTLLFQYLENWNKGKNFVSMFRTLGNTEKKRNFCFNV